MWIRELPLEARYHAVIVETKEYENFGETVRNNLKFIPEDFALTVFCSDENFIKQELQGLKFNLIKIPQKTDINKLLTSLDFWKEIGSRQSFDVEKVLLFSVNSVLIKHGLKDFMKWDFVGAPLKDRLFGCSGELSLRSVNVMKEICRLYSYDNSCSESEWFCRIMIDKKIGKIASKDICERFSYREIERLETIGFEKISLFQ